MTTETEQPTPGEAAPVSHPPIAAWADIAPRQFVDRTWRRWWPLAAAAAAPLLWAWLMFRYRPDPVAIVCGGIIGLLAIVFFVIVMEKSIRAVTVDSAGVHARHGFGATTHLPWERIADITGGGRYGPPLALIARDSGLALHRRLSGWPELYALVRQARPEFWTQLDPSRLKSATSPWPTLIALLQLPYALTLVAGERPFFRLAGIVVVALVLFSFVVFLFDPRSIELSAEGLRVKYPLRSRFVSRSDIAGFSFVEHPFWRRGVKLRQTSGRLVHLGITG